MFCLNKIDGSDTGPYLTVMSRSLKVCPCRMSVLLVATHSFLMDVEVTDVIWKYLYYLI